jgi:hypothetical protein
MASQKIDQLVAYTVQIVIQYWRFAQDYPGGAPLQRRS